MPLPANVKVIKIHPAIGIARVSRNDDFYTYGEDPAAYKTNGLMRRQAVQFRLFAYGDNNQGIEELTPQRLADLGVNVVWHARIANRKVAAADLRADDSFVLQAQASSNQNGGKLVGQLNGFAEGNDIPLGEIRPNGLFIPPKARIARATTTTPLSGGSLHDKNVSDNVGDGFISVTLTDATSGQTVNVPILPACVLIAPADFSPEQDDPDLYPREHLYDFLLQQVGGQNVRPANPVNATARKLDREALKRATTDFRPGIEFSPDGLPANLSSIFYPAAQTGDANELRVLPRTGASGPGIRPGQMTLGLCSPWQFDFKACTCSYWAAQRPDSAFKDDTSPTPVKWLRKKVNDSTGSQGEITVKQLIEHVDKLGVVRVRNQRAVETERTEDIP
jgi:hypothetical protein